VATDIHEGDLPANAAVITLDTKDLVLDSIKKAQDGTGIICRIHNPVERQASGTLRFNAEVFGQIKSAVAVDLMERSSGAKGLSLDGDSISIRLSSRKITSVRVVFG
jgi:alpha-mannosidase